MRAATTGMGSHFTAWIMHLKNPPLRASFAIGFCILFAFIGTFTYVNFVLVQPPFSVDAMTLGIIYFVFLPSIATTPLAGRAVARFGTRATFWGALAVAALGLPLMLSASLAAFLAGMVLVGVGTFFAQATATGFVGRAASSDRGSASGLYLAFYFFGGLMGAAVLGQLFDRFGWEACVAGIGVSLLIAALLASTTSNLRQKPGSVEVRNLDLAQSLGALTSLAVVKAAAAMSCGGLLLCLGGLDRTGNTAAIGAALALAVPALQTSYEKGTALPKAGPLLACCGNR
jgi:predicted MFS family arabinose efflux permease